MEQEQDKIEQAQDRNSRKERLRSQLAADLSGRMQVEDEELREQIDKLILEEGQSGYLPLGQKLSLKKELFDSFRRLDLLQELIEDPEVTEIMVNGAQHIFVERGGILCRWEKHFTTSEQLEDLIQQIVSRVNRTVNLASPITDARLEDGSRVHVVLAPVALDGPALTIRKFPEPITVDKLISYGSISRETADFLKKLVAARYNIFVSGGTGSGKTTFLNALSEFISREERIITIEDSAELQIRHIPNLVRLETRNGNQDGSREITVRELIRASLRMRPDRILVGEVRGAEALEMLQAMNTGHDGSLSTGHGNSTKDMVSRLETMVLMAADLPLPAVRSQIASALDILIHVGRLRDRSRKVLEITEVKGFENGEVSLNCLYRFQELKGGKRGRVEGTLRKEGELIHREKLYAAGVE